MSLIMLYILYSTSVLSFYIDVVLTLSIKLGNSLLPGGPKPLSGLMLSHCSEVPKEENLNEMLTHCGLVTPYGDL